MSLEIVIGVSVIAVVAAVLMNSLRQKNPSAGNHVRGIPDEHEIRPDDSGSTLQLPDGTAAMPEKIRLSPEDFADQFFSGMLSAEEASEEFGKIKGKSVVWDGVIRNAFRYNSDLVFGAEPGVRLMIDVCQIPDEYGIPQTVSAIAAFPASFGGTGPARKLCGRRIRFRGTLLKIEMRTKNVFLRDACEA